MASSSDLLLRAQVSVETLVHYLFFSLAGAAILTIGSNYYVNFVNSLEISDRMLFVVGFISLHMALVRHFLTPSDWNSY